MSTDQRPAATTVAVVMMVQAATLAVASILHLTGHVHGRAAPFDSDHAGIAEAIIAVVLAGAAVGMLRLPHRARLIGMVANGLAIVGFLNGLAFTSQGGHAPDIAYHVVMLPIFAANLLVLLRSRGHDTSDGGGVGGAGGTPGNVQATIGE